MVIDYSKRREFLFVSSLERFLADDILEPFVLVSRNVQEASNELSLAFVVTTDLEEFLRGTLGASGVLTFSTDGSPKDATLREQGEWDFSDKHSTFFLSLHPPNLSPSIEVHFSRESPDSVSEAHLTMVPSDFLRS